MMVRLTGFLATLSVAFVFHTGLCARAQNPLPNPGFEKGTNAPDGWRLTEGAGNWSGDARSGQHAITVEGDGRNSFAWRTERLGLAPGALYRLRFAAKGDLGAGGGSIISGVSRVNRDFHATDSWQEHAFVFSFPNDAPGDYARLGQWEIKGRVSFDDAELLPVLATHTRLPGGD